MADTTCNFFINSAFNANFDITWSFKYAMNGTNGSSGGFSTFLFGNSALSGGGTYTGMGYAPNSPDAGVSNGKIGVTFDSTNTIKVYGTNFIQITSFQMPSYIVPLVNPTDNHNIIRFNFTNVQQTLKIAYKNKETNRYITFATIPTGLIPKDDDYYRVGFGYSSPLSAGGTKSSFKIKDIHIQGNLSEPKTTYKKRPDINEGIETFYILQTPLSGEIYIGKPDPITVGSLIHN
jgi:hypothetical protein